MDVQPTNPAATAVMLSCTIWSKISEECFQHLVESMPRKIRAVLKAKGGQQGVPNKVASECILHNVLC